MSHRYRHIKTGDICEPKKYAGGYRAVLELNSLENFKKFAKIAHSARLTKVGTTQDNVLSFSELEEI